MPGAKRPINAIRRSRFPLLGGGLGCAWMAINSFIACGRESEERFDQSGATRAAAETAATGLRGKLTAFDNWSDPRD
jgi:hypothetical protein